MGLAGRLVLVRLGTSQPQLRSLWNKLLAESLSSVSNPFSAPEPAARPLAEAQGLLRAYPPRGPQLALHPVFSPGPFSSHVWGHLSLFCWLLLLSVRLQGKSLPCFQPPPSVPLNRLASSLLAVMFAVWTSATSPASPLPDAI